MDIFIPNGDSRTDTAVLLVGTAEEHDIPQSSIRATTGGFWVSEDLADLIYGDEPEVETTKTTTTTTKASSNRAAKKDSKEENSGD